MRKRYRTIVYLLLGALAALALALLGTYQAMVAVPEEYRAVVEADPEEQRQASDELLQQAAALASDVRQQRDWEAWFTEAQINGWLAVDLIENHPDALPEHIRDPRVAIREGTISLYCRTRRGGTETVLTLVVEPYLDEPNVLGLRFRKVRAGMMPLPMGGIVNEVGKAARDLELKLTWRQADGDPVALVTIPFLLDDEGRTLWIERIEVRDGELYLAGGSKRPETAKERSE